MNAIYLHDAERRCFALCGFDSTQAYKRTAMFLLLTVVKHNRSISVPKLKFDMEKKYRIPADHIDGILRGLFSPDGLDVISIKKMRKEVVTISSPTTMETWMNAAITQHPELKGYTV